MCSRVRHIIPAIPGWASEEVPEVCTVRFNRAVTLRVSSEYLVQWRLLKNVRS